MLTRGVDDILKMLSDLGLQETLRSVGAALAITVKTGEYEYEEINIQDLGDGYNFVSMKGREGA